MLFRSSKEDEDLERAIALSLREAGSNSNLKKNSSTSNLRKGESKKDVRFADDKTDSEDDPVILFNLPFI